MTATRESLLAWVHACGVAALDAVFREQAEAVAGPEQLRGHGLLEPRRSVSLFAADGTELATLLVGAERGEELMVWRRGAREVLALERRALDAWPRILEDLLGESDDAATATP